MGIAKSLHVAPISQKDAAVFVRRVHYSGKIVQNSSLHLGVFLNGKLEGVMQFGSSLDKHKMQGIVENTGWNDFLELNRMAFSEALPRNSESRALSIAFKLIKKHYPHIEWVVSFADGTQCGDGAIYRASGFVLTQINKSMNLVRCKSGEVIHKMTLESNPTAPRPELDYKSYYEITGGKYDLKKYVDYVSGEIIAGFQIRYIYSINKDAIKRLTVPILPFSKIDEMGAGMYKGQKRMKGQESEHPSDLGGSTPTHALHE